jgi:RND family efflux transporter MFP subunit
MKKLLRTLVSLVILGAAVGAAVYLVRTKPQARERPRPALTALVEVMEARSEAAVVIVRGMGTVIPARETTILPEVTGMIVALNPNLVPGGRVQPGEELARIDPRDYETARDQARAALEKARFDLTVEDGRRTVAGEEWSRLGGEVPTSETGRALALREPHLRLARASLEAAESALRRAELNLERTTLKAPFAAVVLEETVDPGQVVTPQSRVARLVGTASFWAQILVPAADLGWFAWPDAAGAGGAEALIELDLGGGTVAGRTGRVVRVQADLDTAGRMARLLVEVQDPLDVSAGAPLLLGSYVSARISGRPMPDVFEVSRAAVREGDCLWIMNSKDELEIRPVTIARRRPETVLVGAGLKSGDRIVTSRIALPIPQMKLRLAGSEARTDPR